MIIDEVWKIKKKRLCENLNGVGSEDSGLVGREAGEEE